MTHPIRAFSLAFLVCTGAAFAQSPDVVEEVNEVPMMPEDDFYTTETQRPAGSPGQLNADGVYTVTDGDTLWDLSQQFLNNPWYWPKIWADNPYVDNPHWIYPGNQLRIRSGDDGLPGEITVAEEEAEEEETVREAPSEVAAFTTGSVHRTDNLGQASDLVSIAGRGHITLEPTGLIRAQISSLVTSRELADTGVIESSFEQKELLSTFDRVYVRFGKGAQPRVGDQHSLFRTSNEIIHPITGSSWGYQTKIMGTLRIVEISKDVAVGEIGEVTDYVTRGDRVGPAAVLHKAVTPVPNESEVEGIVLATEIPDQQEIGESHVVFIDQGSKAGVVEGNTFTIFHSGDGLDRLSLGSDVKTTSIEMPEEAVATLVVFDVRDDASAALVVKSLREVKIGDSARMKPVSAGAGGF